MPPLKGVTRHRRDYPPALAPSGGTRAVTGTEFSGGVPGKAQLSFGQKVFARKGTVLIEEGSENSALFVVGHGALSISVHGEEIATVGPGQVIGLYTMLKGTLASASVVVSSDVAYILELRHSHFMACLDDNPDVKNRMQVLLEQREAQNKAAEMISKTTLREV
ncbi:hypothetical protein AK812_SmicGene30072 [Symbiodinium microadriaticum]|uniref:Cyclic nucleotide-binding domain-containing protein n=1 Tax=Symbiodinium microadriaticum TaxID=2951 RepID=A0A1Q9D094_SYMMI|nr:hypothetical protein AK812_SmicGene30072 [Symbiodinium microadriaticum]